MICPERFYRYWFQTCPCQQCAWYQGIEEEKLCFAFVADCGGDEIALCLDCLKEAVARMEGGERWK